MEELTAGQEELVKTVKEFIQKSRGRATLLFFSCKKDGYCGVGVSTALYHGLASYVGRIEWCCSSQRQVDDTLDRLVEVHKKRTDWTLKFMTPFSLHYINTQFRVQHDRAACVLPSTPLTPEVDLLIYDNLNLSSFSKAVQDCATRNCMSVLALTAHVSELDQARELVQKYASVFGSRS